MRNHTRKENSVGFISPENAESRVKPNIHHTRWTVINSSSSSHSSMVGSRYIRIHERVIEKLSSAWKLSRTWLLEECLPELYRAGISITVASRFLDLFVRLIAQPNPHHFNHVTIQAKDLCRVGIAIAVTIRSLDPLAR